MNDNRIPHNVEFFYKGGSTKSQDWPVVLGSLAFFGAQLAFVAWLLLR